MKVFKKVFKKLIVVLSLFLSMTAVACARNVVLTWDQEPPETGLTWDVYRAQGACSAEAVFTKITQVTLSTKTHTDAGVPYGRLCYHVTASFEDPVEGVLVSDPSEPTTVVVTPSSPTNIQRQLQ